MQTQPKARPIDGKKNLDDLFPNRFLKPEDLLRWKATQVTVTIDRLVEEEVTPKPGQPPTWKPVLYFRTKTGAVHPQGYLLSAKVDKDALKAATSAQTIGELIGKQITIQLSTWKNDTVLRIDPNPPAQPKPAPAPGQQPHAAATAWGIHHRSPGDKSMITNSKQTWTMPASLWIRIEGHEVSVIVDLLPEDHAALPLPILDGPAKAKCATIEGFWITTLQFLPELNQPNMDKKPDEDQGSYMTEREWNQLGYRWAKYREINWYHAMADIDYYRQTKGDQEAYRYIISKLGKAEGKTA